jgi:hypothetical protein
MAAVGALSTTLIDVPFFYFFPSLPGLGQILGGITVYFPR